MKPSVRDTRPLLIGALLLTVIAWQFHWGQLLLYPFTLLATYAHELGHGMTAILVGANFESLVLYPNGSGLARWTGNAGRIARATIAAGGLIGPSIAGALVLVLSRRIGSKLLLGGVGGFMAITVLLFGSSLFTWVFVGGVAAALFALLRFAPESVRSFFVQLVGAQLCLSVFRDVSYMFSAGGMVGGKQHISDSAAIAEALFLPYWFWGGLVAIVAFVVLSLGLYVSLRRPAKPAPESV